MQDNVGHLRFATAAIQLKLSLTSLGCKSNVMDPLFLWRFAVKGGNGSAKEQPLWKVQGRKSARLLSICQRISFMCMPQTGEDIFYGERRSARIPGVGLLSAKALAAVCGNPQDLKNGRQFAAWLGLVLRRVSTGGKPTLLGIRKLHTAKGTNLTAVAVASN